MVRCFRLITDQRHMLSWVKKNLSTNSIPSWKSAALGLQASGQIFPKLLPGFRRERGEGMRLLLGTLLGLMLGVTASADSVWTYTGNKISYLGFNPGPGGVAPPDDIGVNPCGCAMFGTVVLDDANKAIAWSFTNGADTINNLNSHGTIDPIGQFNFDTIFRHWSIFLTANDNSVSVFSSFNGSFGDAQDSMGNLSVESNPGVWAEIATPEPGTLLMVGVGLAALTLVRRRKADIPATTWEPLG
jgi:hypothetical protein